MQVSYQRRLQLVTRKTNGLTTVTVVNNPETRNPLLTSKTKSSRQPRLCASRRAAAPLFGGKYLNFMCKTTSWISLPPRQNPRYTESRMDSSEMARRGGLARAQALSPERRSEIAQKGGIAARGKPRKYTKKAERPRSEVRQSSGPFATRGDHQLEKLNPTGVHELVVYFDDTGGMFSLDEARCVAISPETVRMLELLLKLELRREGADKNCHFRQIEAAR
ncbi:MAG: hypothetical protein J2P13_03585 [Acidobacteria bacterium]|nr:hypothetical protein [Acidobacteriota bacterium]